MFTIFRRINNFSYSFILLLTIFCAYGTSLKNNWISDDLLTIAENPFTHSLKNLPKVFTRDYFTSPEDLSNASQITGAGEMSYRPVVTLSYFLDYQIWGLNPFGYHLTNILLHSANAILIFLLVSLFTGQKPLGFFSALFFSLHPVQAEAILIPSYREDLLAVFFGALAWLNHLYVMRPSDHHKRFDILTPMLLILAMFSKEVGILWVFWIWLYDQMRVSNTQGNKGWQSAFKNNLYNIFMAGLYIVIWTVPMKKVSGGFEANHFTNATEQILLSLKIMGGYITWIIWPWHIPAMTPTSTIPFEPWNCYLNLSLLLIGVFIFVRFNNSQIGRFTIIALIIQLLAISQLIPLENIMTSRYLYFPLIWVSIIVGILFETILKKSLMTVKILLVLYFIICSFIINDKIRNWKDEIHFRAKIVKDFPHNKENYRNLAGAYERQKQYTNALEALSQAKAVDPNDARFYIDSALIYLKLNNKVQAKEELETAKKLQPNIKIIYLILDQIQSDGHENPH